MASLIDTIENAVAAERAQAEHAGGEIRATLVVEAIECYCKVDDAISGIVEGIVDDAYLAARRTYGNDWPAYTGHVAELVCDGLRRFATGGIS